MEDAQQEAQEYFVFDMETLAPFYEDGELYTGTAEEIREHEEFDRSYRFLPAHFTSWQPDEDLKELDNHGWFEEDGDRLTPRPKKEDSIRTYLRDFNTYSYAGIRRKLERRNAFE